MGLVCWEFNVSIFVTVMDISRPCQPEKLIILLPDQDSIPVSQDTMIDEQSLASGLDYASDRSAIGADGDECGEIYHIYMNNNSKCLFSDHEMLAYHNR